MKSRSLNLGHADEREGARTRRRSPTASETAQRPRNITHRSKFLRPSFSPSSSSVSSSTQNLYPRFLRLFRHPFGNRRSPYREQSKAWLSSLGSNHICNNCRQTRWQCDTQELRCQPCIEKHATCPRTLQFKKFFIMNEMHLTEDMYDKLVKLIPRMRKRKSGIGSTTSSSHPPARQTHRLNSTQMQGTIVPSDVESEEVDELDHSEPSSDDLPLQSKLSSNRSRPIDATRLPQIRQEAAQVTIHTPNRCGPTSSPTSTSNLQTAPDPVVITKLDSARVIDELSGIRLALTRMDEHLSDFLSKHAKSQPPVTITDRGTHIITPPPPRTTVSESRPTQNSDLHTTTSQINVASGTGVPRNEVENPEIMWHIQASRESQQRGPTNDLGERGDVILGGRFMTPYHVLPTIVTLGGEKTFVDVDSEEVIE